MELSLANRDICNKFVEIIQVRMKGMNIFFEICQKYFSSFRSLPKIFCLFRSLPKIFLVLFEVYRKYFSFFSKFAENILSYFSEFAENIFVTNESNKLDFRNDFQSKFITFV